MENMIDITGADLVEVVKAAYDLSSPQGLGFLHHEEGSLTDEQAKSLINEDRFAVVGMDYVKGRACKFSVLKQDEKLYINNTWYDHSDDQLAALLDRIGVEHIPN